MTTIKFGCILGLMLFNVSDWLERSFVYFPEKHLETTPSQIGLTYQEVLFQAEGKRQLHGWWLTHAAPKATLLFLHGNAGNISHRLEKIRLLNEVGFSIFIFDYSGFGKSEGLPSERKLYEDGIAAYDHLVKALNVNPTTCFRAGGPLCGQNRWWGNPKRILLYGESLGCAVAIELARQRRVDGLILETPFVSLKEMAKAHMPLLSPLAGNKFNNLEKIEKIKVPKFFIHSREDEIVPFQQALKLYGEAPHPKTYLWFDKGGHNDAFLIHAKLFKETLRDFLKDFLMAK